jgi:phytoene dehydrogenase-like protein
VLGDAVEVIETASPQTFYETTRRKFGMIGRPAYAAREIPPDFGRPFMNVFIISDTTTAGSGVASVAKAALDLSDLLEKSS